MFAILVTSLARSIIFRPAYSDETQPSSTSSWVASAGCYRHFADATQRRVELRRYRHPHWVTTFRIDRWQLFTLWTCRQLDVELSCVGVTIDTLPTQLNVELCRYKRAFTCVVLACIEIKYQDEMEKTHYWKKCSLTLTFNSKQVHEQQCLKVTQLMFWQHCVTILMSGTFNINAFAYPLSITCLVNVLYFLKFCPIFSIVSTICTVGRQVATLLHHFSFSTTNGTVTPQRKRQMHQ